MNKLPKTTRFAIIGAGAAGLSTAIALKKRGFKHVTVFEKDLEIGGKCHSYSYQGQNFDFGANLTTPRYHQIRALANEVGMTFRHPPQRRIINVGNQPFKSPMDLDFVTKILIRVGALVYSIIRGLTKINQPGYANLSKGLEKPFKLWLKSHGLGRFTEMFQILFVSYGYGHLMDLPAAYALKFFDHIHLNASVDVILGKDVETTLDFQEGFQELWKRLKDKYQISVLTNIDIQAVERKTSGVEIKYQSGPISNTCRFDKIIIACPLQNLDFLDKTQEEKDLLQKISTYDYYVTLAEIENLPPISTYVYPYAKTVTPGYPTVFYPPNGGKLFLSYAYGGIGVDERKVHQKLRETVENPAVGGKVTKFIHTQKWQYFPHIKSEDMQSGFYDQLENLQGQFHTYYVGEVMSFTLVELIYDYCDALVSKF